MKAIWNNELIAESDQTIVIEGNHYFPMDSLNEEFLKPSSTKTICSWKGTASYYNLEVNGKENPDSVWFYESPKPAAIKIENHAAFWKGVSIQL